MKIIDIDSLNSLGLYININTEEIFINQFIINYTHENKYIKLKIISEISIYN